MFHTKICMKVIEESVRLIRTEVCINATDRHIHFCHFPSVGIGLLTVNRNASTVSAMSLKEFHALYEHTPRATTRVIYTAVIERFQNCNDSLNDTGRRIELAAFNTFISSELCNTVFVSSAQKIFAFFRIRHIHVCEQVNNITQNSLIQIRTCVILRKYIFQRFVFCFDCSHCIVNDSSNLRSMSRRCDSCPSCFFRNEENIFAQVFITIFFKTLFKRLYLQHSYYLNQIFAIPRIKGDTVLKI